MRGLVLLDALYGERDKFVSWAEGPGRKRLLPQRLFDLFARGQRRGPRGARGCRCAEREQPAGPLTPGVVAFVDAGSVDHNDFVTSAWGGAPLRDIFSRIGG